jgi:hypothetical protein
MEKVITLFFENKRYVCLRTTEQKWWICLNPVFSRKIPKFKKLYPEFEFQKWEQLSELPKNTVSRLKRESVFLSFEDFSLLLKHEKLDALLFMFEKELEVTSQVLTELSQAPDEIIPLRGYVYIMKFVSLGLGKIGITRNWKSRGSKLLFEYATDGVLVFHALTEDADGIEQEMKVWLEQEGALLSHPTRKKNARNQPVMSTETFSLEKKSVAEVQAKLETLLVTRNSKKLTLETLVEVVVQRGKEDPDFLLDAVAVMSREYFRSIPISERKKMFAEMLSLPAFQEKINPQQLLSEANSEDQNSD